MAFRRRAALYGESNHNEIYSPPPETDEEATAIGGS
jgi:hypothetical protein